MTLQPKWAEENIMYDDVGHSLGSGTESDEKSEKSITANREPIFKISNVVTLTHQELRKIRSRKSNHIKRPLNAFMAYSKVHRRKIMDAYPDMHHAAVSKELGATWKSFTPDQKKPFYDEAKRLAEEHVLRYPGYKYKPKARKLKEDIPHKFSTPITLPSFVSFTNTAKPTRPTEINNDYGTQSANTDPSAGRISPSNFHAWSLIYESEAEEEDEEEMEDSD